MRIDFHYIHIDPTPTVEQHAQKTFLGLERLVTRLDPDQGALLKLEFIRSTQHHQKGDDVYEVKAKLDLPKKVFMVTARDADLHAGLDAVKHKLLSLVERYKEQATGRPRNN